MYSDKNVTIVSYFYIIKSKFSLEKYLEWISNFLYIGFKSIIYTNEETKMVLLNHFPNIEENNKLIIYEIRDFYTSKYNWDYDYNIDYEKNKHSINLYKLWNEKIIFLRKASELNYYSTEYFLLLDIGSFRNKNKLEEIKNYNFPTHNNFIKNKLTMFYYSNFTIENSKNAHIIDNRFYSINIDQNTFVGGLFGGDKQSIINFEYEFKKILDVHKKKGIFSGKDQNIYNFVVLNNPNLIHLLNSHIINKSYDSWFCFHYYFSDYFKTKISILIAIYNGIEYFEECLDSILNQTFQNFEILIGINGWDFKSICFKKCKDITQLDKYSHLDIKIYDCGKFNVKNSKSKTLNFLVTKSVNDYVAVLDVDDKWCINKLEKQINYLKYYDVIGTKCQYFGESQKIPKIPVNDLTNFNFKLFNPIINSSSIIKKKLAFWSCDTWGVEDYELWCSLKDKNYKFFNLNEILTFHRVYSNSFFNSNKKQQIEKEKLFNKI